jgi:hypothetical protein
MPRYCSRPVSVIGALRGTGIANMARGKSRVPPRPLRAAKNVRETHPTYPLVNACPVHPNPQSWRATEPDTSRATKPGQITS